MKEIVFLSFCDSKFANSMERIKQETKAFPFTKRLFWTEKDLPYDFRKSLKNRLYPRGYGYWKWKPYIIKMVLSSLKEGDILVYSDSGNHWESKGEKRFNEYIELLDKDDSGILAFQEAYLMKDYTKSDLLEYFGLAKDISILMSKQLWSGLIMIKKNANSSEAIELWNDIHQNHYDLTTDKRSSSPNTIGFIEHRHDQSTWSVVVLTRPHILIPWFETQKLYYKEWDLDTQSYPVQARRLNNKGLSLLQKIMKKVMYPCRKIRQLYLITFQDFYFHDNRIF